MRDMKTLLRILRCRVYKRDGHGLIGMCAEVVVMWSHGIITCKEERFLLAFIRNNIPDECRDYKFDSGGYWWKRGLVKPRIDWLTKHIKLNS